MVLILKSTDIKDFLRFKMTPNLKNEIARITNAHVGIEIYKANKCNCGRWSFIHIRDAVCDDFEEYQRDDMESELSDDSANIENAEVDASSYADLT